MRPLLRAARLAAALAAVVVVAACSGDSEATLLSSARGYLDKHDAKAAVIQLKNLLQKNPDSGPARLLMGRALSELGDPAGAMVEYRKAQALHVADEDLLPEMARAMMLTGEAAKVTAQFAGTELKHESANADLHATVGAAFALQGNVEQAKAQSARALQASPGYAPAVVLQAQLKAMDKDIDGALALLDDVLRKDPADARAGLMRGELLWRVRGDRDGAAAAFRQVIGSNPRSVQARTSLVGVLSEQAKTEEAAKELAELKKVAPSHPDTLYLEARAAYAAKDYRGASDIAARLVKGMPDNPIALEIAGASAYQLRGYQQAETQLARAVKLAPDRVLARQLLAQTYLRTGQATRAIETLQPLVDNAKADGPSLAVAGEAYLQAGDPKRADEAFRRAALAAPQNTQVRTAVAVSRAAHGQLAQALPELESLAATGNDPRADFALVSARLAQKDTAGALKAIDALQKKLPDSAQPDYLRGRVLVLRDDRAGAARAFEAALAKDKNYYPAVAALSALDLAAGKPADARKRFEALLQSDPKNAQAHMALAELAARAGAGAPEIARHLDEAVKAAPEDPTPRVRLVDVHLKAGDPKTALSAAQSAAAALPDNPAILDALGRAQLAAGDSQQALSTFGRWTSQQPTNPLAQVRLAEAQFAAGDRAGARTSLRKALEIDPKLFAAQRALATLALADKRPDDAVAAAREWQTQHADDAAGFALEGEIEASRRNWAAAATALRAALQRAKTPELAIALHAALLNGGQRAEADRWAADWQRQQPRDLAFRYHLGDVAMAARDYAGAERHYRAVLEAQPRNALAMNNVAWLLVQQGKPGGLPLAEQANEALPGRAALMDTLAAALAAENQLPRAIEIQKQAVERSRQDPGLRLNLARLYAKAGDKSKATAELQSLAKLGDAFPAQAEVAALLKSVQ
ncbi:MAG: XrtA/PEP-CTERM system TPR-repeat protein PrsT [Rubrivivax sp.]